MNTKLILSIATTLTLTACATGQSGDVYTRGQVRQIQTYKVGVIEQVNKIRIEGTKSQIGTAAGTIAGGIAGSTTGNGKVGEVASVLGAVVGGMVGAAAEEAYTRENGIEMGIKLENGDHISIVQAQSVNDAEFKVGEKVRIIENGGVTRVTH